MAEVVDITARQEKAIAALINETTVARAARTSGIGLRTLHRWLVHDPAFRAAYRSARREAFGQAVALTQRYAPLAVTTLAQILSDPTAPSRAAHPCRSSCTCSAACSAQAFCLRNSSSQADQTVSSVGCMREGSVSDDHDVITS
ncbi:MAG TPA: hypothetical protein PLU35_13315 [Phycisphaerales bacterium]|nr:hypothetical protein [Phycisphaerales bacterium]